jgi:L-alanine-DL-glutamate epimerase-like enolase superfamily enzyme
MKITAVEAIPLRVRGFDKEHLDGSQDDLLIRIQTDNGVEGIGEVDASPEIVKAIVDAPTSHGWSKGIREILIGENPLDVERLWDRMYKGSIYYGRRAVAIAAISGVDIALWDLVGKAEDKSVSELLHSKSRNKIKVYASLYPIGRTLEDMERNCRFAITKGFRAIKLDGAPLGQNAKSDEQILRAARKSIGEKSDLMTDVTEPGWNIKQAISRARMYSEYNVYFLEAPFGPDDLESYGRLSEAVDLRIAYGEQHTTRYEFIDLIEKGRVDIIQPDISRAGGITEVRRIAKIAQDRGVPLIPHCWKTGISIAANLHLLATIRNAPYLEFALPPNSPASL